MDTVMCISVSGRPSNLGTRFHNHLYAELGLDFAYKAFTTSDIVGAILGETGLPSGTVGVIDIRDRHLFADVASEHANAIIAKLNRTQIKGQRVKVKIA